MPHNHQWQRKTKRFDRKCPQRDQIPMTYTQLLPYLIQQGLIIPKGIPPIFYPYGPKYNPKASCAFHAGYVGHATEDCGLFKTRVQELIDQKILSLSSEGPNAKDEKGECNH